MCLTECWGHKRDSLVHFGTENTRCDQSLLLQNAERQEGTSLEAAGVAGSWWGATAGCQQGLCLSAMLLAVGWRVGSITRSSSGA